MHAGIGHEKPSVFLREILPVGRFRLQGPVKLRDRNVVFPADDGRIGKGPQHLRFRKPGKFRLQPPIHIRQFPDGIVDAAVGGGIDLRLIFTEIPDDVLIAGKRVRGMGKTSVLRQTQGFPLQPELAVEQNVADIRVVCVYHVKAPYSKI